MGPDREGHTCRPPEGWVVVNGVRIDPRSRRTFLETVESFLMCGRPHVVRFLAADPTVRARADRVYRDLLNRGNLNLPDGMSVALAARMFGRPARRLAGTEGMQFVLEWGVDHELAHYLYGGTPEVSVELQRRLSLSYPGVRIAAAEAPPFREPSEQDLRAAAERIRAARTQALWVGLGVPRQDFVAEDLARRGAAPLIFAVGAAFDFLGGGKTRAPRWMQQSGLEWLHRLLTEPTRLWRRYLIGNPRFVAGVASDWVRDRAVRRRSEGGLR